MHVDDTEAPVAGTEGSIHKSRVAVAYTFGGRPGLSVESPFGLGAERGAPPMKRMREKSLVFACIEERRPKAHTREQDTHVTNVANLARPLDVRDEAGTKRTGRSVGYTNFGAERWSTCCLGNVGHDGVELQVTPEVSGGSFDGAVVVLIEKCDKAGSVVVDRGD